MSDTTINEVVETKPVVQAPAVIKVEKLTITALAEAICKANVKFTPQVAKATSYIYLETAVDGKVNFSKGPSFLVSRYGAGVTVELLNYGRKNGLYLMEFKDVLKKFDGTKLANDTVIVQFKEFIKSGKLRILLPDTLGLEKVTEIALEFITLLDPVAEEIRSKVVMPAAVVKPTKKIVSSTDTTGAAAPAKKTGKARTKKAAPAPAVAAVVPVTEIPAEITDTVPQA